MFLREGCPVKLPFEIHGLAKCSAPISPEVVHSPARSIPCTPITDDFYTSLLDWSRNTIYYASDSTVYAYDFHSDSTASVYDNPGAVITAIKYNSETETLCVGNTDGVLAAVDPASGKYDKYLLHRSRIGAVESYGTGVITGSRDRRTRIFDLRIKAPVAMFASHTQEICGVALNNCNRYLATGGNDNRVFVYDLRGSLKPFARLGEHRAAIKALAWSPTAAAHLLTGSGTADKTLRLWDMNVPNLLIRAKVFESQICNLRWLRDNTVLATFGYSNNDIKLLSNFNVIRQFRGHRDRVIHFALSDDQYYFASGSADSTLRIWDVDAKKDKTDIKIR